MPAEPDVPDPDWVGGSVEPDERLGFDLGPDLTTEQGSAAPGDPPPPVDPELQATLARFAGLAEMAGLAEVAAPPVAPSAHVPSVTSLRPEIESETSRDALEETLQDSAGCEERTAGQQDAAELQPAVPGLAQGFEAQTAPATGEHPAGEQVEVAGLPGPEAATDELAIGLASADQSTDESTDESTDDETLAELARSEAATTEPALAEVVALSDPTELARVMCAVLLTSREPLSVFRLAQVCNTSQQAVRAGLETLESEFRRSGLPLSVARTDDTVRILTLPEVYPYLERQKGIRKAERLSPAALETLAVVAYRQPVMRVEIEAIRGVKVGPMLRALLEHKLVTVVGRADVPGRPLQYGTTQQFLDRFGLSSLKDLPSLKEARSLL